MSLSDNWGESFLEEAKFAPWDKANYDSADWKVVPFHEDADSSLSVKIGLQGFDLTSVVEACAETNLLICGAFEKTDGWALATVATIPVVVPADAEGEDTPDDDTDDVDAVVAGLYGVWFEYSKAAFVVSNEIEEDDTTLVISNAVLTTIISTTPTASVPDEDDIFDAVDEYAETTCDYGMCPGFIEYGDSDAIASGAQKIYAYNLLSGFENDDAYFEVGDKINIWAIDAIEGVNTNTAAFELAGAGSLAVTLGAAALAALAMM
jgi:hypothetical protein